MTTFISRFIVGALVTMLLIPATAAAQCGSRSSGSTHDHGTAVPPRGTDPVSDAIRFLLSTPQHRETLMSALLSSPDFLRDFVSRLATYPEWRALMVQQLEAVEAGESAQAAPPDSTERSVSQPATIYSCAMHPDVRSNQPGTCPKCGMRLEPLK